MKGFGAAIILALAAVVIAGCGGDNNTTFVLQSGTPVPGTATGSAGASSSPTAAPTGTTLPNTAATPIQSPAGYRIIIDSPDARAQISSPVEVSGTASVDRGTVVAVVLDAAGNELGRGTTVASAVRPDWGHYDASVSFSGATPGTKGQIKVFGVNPRDGVTPTFYYFIAVSFS